jgi:acetyltransferase
MDLQTLFYPKSVAVVGASTKIGSVGNDIAKNLATQGFAGQVYPVNPKADNLYGLKCYPTLTAVGAPIDLMVIVVPAVSVAMVLREGAGLGIKTAVIISAGFKESGHPDLEEEVAKIANENQITLLGPNCLGFINPEINLNASFSPVLPIAGGLAFISQSGALGTAILDYATAKKIGFSKFISSGNKAVLDETDFLGYLANDEKTKVIALYVEELKGADKLIPLIRSITHGSKPKPVIILKAGTTAAGAQAAASHTGALAGTDSAYDALCSQSGALRAATVAELFDYLNIFLHNPIVPARRLAIVTNAGGPGVLATDAVVENGLEMAKLSEATTVALRAALPPAANYHNPIDVLGDARVDRYQIALQAVLADENTDAALVILTPQTMTEIEATARAIVEIKQKSNKPLAAAFMGGNLVAPGIEILRQSAVTAFPFPEPAIRALKDLDAAYRNSQEPAGEDFVFSDIDKEKVNKILAAAKASGQKFFTEVESDEILSAYDFPLLKSRLARSAAEAEAIAKEFSESVALKIVSSDISHKSDTGGVALHIKPENVAAEYGSLLARVNQSRPEAKIDGVLVQAMADKGTEMILGGLKDANLGSLAMVGLGGIYTEIFKDAAFGLAPLTRQDAERLVKNLKCYPILAGVRGQAGGDLPALIDCFGRLSRLLADFPEIKELDINPLLVLPAGQGVKVVDARVVLE